MVSIKAKKTTHTSKDQLDIQSWLASIAGDRSEEEIKVIRQACDFSQQAHADQFRVSGEPYFQHAIAVANILSELNLDHETITAAILHDVVEDTRFTLKDIQKSFGKNITSLVEGVTKMKLIQAFQALPGTDKKEHIQSENLRKMLLAMAEDIRVVLIKLADRTHNMRTLGALSKDKQARIAQETLDIYAPLANRLGIWQIKWELEDLSLRYLEPEVYKKIAGMLDERRIDREQYINKFINQLNVDLGNASIKADICGRPKHIYSIWHKMERKNLDYHQIYDIRGIRVLIDSIQDCYAVLGIVHSTWQYIAGEFDDYIATPKENNYQSIHTAVIGPAGKTVEIQIRTHAMHQRNELGVAAHWRYKESAVKDAGFDRKIAWLRNLLEWKDEISDAGEFVDQFKSEVFQDRIYVFTPQGNIIDLPNGSTPLDFAYRIHTEVGHRCRGVKVNGKMTSLTYQLKTGQKVEVLTAKNASPSRDWINPHLGYLKTSKAKSKIQAWFKHQDRDKNIQEGRVSLEKELRRLGITDVSYEKLSAKLGFTDGDDFFVAIAHSEIKSSRFVKAALDLTAPRKTELETIPLTRRKIVRQTQTQAGSVTIQGIGNLMSHMAKCCKPVPGDEIAGYITLGRGVSIHRSDCSNLLRYTNASPDRIISVEWGEKTEETFPVDVHVLAIDRQGLLRDITAVLANDKVNLIAANTYSDHKKHLAQMRLTLEIININELSRVLARINQLSNVIDVKRIMH